MANNGFNTFAACLGCDEKEIWKDYLRATGSLCFLVARDGTYLDFWDSDVTPVLVEPEKFLGRRISDVLPEPAATTCYRSIVEALDSSEVQVVEYNLPIRSETRQFEARVVPTALDHVAVAVREVSGRSPSTSGIDDCRFHALFENVMEPVEVSGQGTVVFVNQAYLNLFGYRSDAEILGRPTNQMVAPASRPLIDLFRAWREADETVPAVFRAQGIRQDGTLIDLEHRVSSYRRGAVLYQIAVLRRVYSDRRVDFGYSRREGRGLAVREARTVGSGTRAESDREKLSNREKQVLKMVAEGKATKEIAGELGISVKTADSHRTHIMAKLGVRNVVQLLRYCVRTGLVEL